eukprot:4864971-Pyramimonas_sp.AAC.1
MDASTRGLPAHFGTPLARSIAPRAPEEVQPKAPMDASTRGRPADLGTPLTRFAAPWGAPPPSPHPPRG